MDLWGLEDLQWEDPEDQWEDLADKWAGLVEDPWEDLVI